MAKVSLARKKELEEPDEFVTVAGRALGFLIEHKTRVAAGVGCVLALVLVITARGYYSDSREKKAFTLYSMQLEAYDARVKDVGEKSAMEEVLKGADQFVSSWSGTRAGVLAEAWFSAMYYRQGDFDKSISMCEGALKSLDSDASYRNAFLLFMGLSYEAKGDNDNALKFYEKVVAADNPLKKDEALFHMGLIYSATGNDEKKDEIFEKLTREYPDYLFNTVVREKSAG